MAQSRVTLAAVTVALACSLASSVVAQQSIGPDVICGDLYQVTRWGQDASGQIQSYSVGTVSCNIGNQNVSWQGSGSNRKPIIGQNLYRLKNGRFEQLGQSWLKWAFTSLNQRFCGDCQNPGTGSLLGINCSDPYSASLNGSQSSLGPKSVVNPFTGDFPASHATPGSGTIAGRLQVATPDVDPNQNAGALYFVEGQYIAADDAAAKNLHNNAAWRQVWVQSSLALSFSSPDGLRSTTIAKDPAVFAWQKFDPVVAIGTFNADPNDGRVYVAWRSYRVDADNWRHEFAVFNLNSHRGIQRFSVPLPEGSTVSSNSFRDVAYHSGEPYVGTDWPAVVGAGSIEWASQLYSQNTNANALRWGTLYNFGFTADVSPEEITTAELAYFRPGDVASAVMSLPAQFNNDACPRALPVGEGVYALDFYAATPDGPAEDACGVAASDADVWFSYTAVCNGTATFATCGSGFDSAIAVYAGGCPLSPGQQIACNNDSCGQQSSVSVPAVSGQLFLVRVSGSTAGVGSLAISCSDNNAVPNDNCAGARDVYDGITLFDNIGATSGGPTETTSCTPGWNGTSDRDVWFRYEATCNGSTVFRTCPSAFETKLAIYRGSCPSAPGTAVGCNDDYCSDQSQVRVNGVIAGEVYLIRVGVGGTGSPGQGVLTIECTGSLPGECSNDKIATAQVIPGLPFTFNGSTAACRNDYDEVCPFAGSQSPDAVFKFVADSADPVTISLCSSDFDTKLYLYEGSVTASAPYACDDDGCEGLGADGFRSRINDLVLNVGRTYYIVVDGYSGASGNYQLDVTRGPALTPGDMNCDGVVDFGDIDAFVLALAGRDQYEAVYPDCNWFNGDLGSNGIVDFSDIDAFIALIGAP